MIGRFCLALIGPLDTPMLLGLRRSEPYLHDGRAITIEQVFTTFNPQDKHGRTSHLSEVDIHALAEFLRYLDPPPPATGAAANARAEATGIALKGRQRVW